MRCGGQCTFVGNAWGHTKEERGYHSGTAIEDEGDDALALLAAAIFGAGSSGVAMKEKQQQQKGKSAGGRARRPANDINDAAAGPFQASCALPSLLAPAHARTGGAANKQPTGQPASGVLCCGSSKAATVLPFPPDDGLPPHKQRVTSVTLSSSFSNNQQMD